MHASMLTFFVKYHPEDGHKRLKHVGGVPCVCISWYLITVQLLVGVRWLDSMQGTWMNLTSSGFVLSTGLVSSVWLVGNPLTLWLFVHSFVTRLFFSFIPNSTRQKQLAVNKTPPIGNLRFNYDIPNSLPVSSYPEPAEFSPYHHNLWQLNISSLLNHLLCCVKGFMNLNTHTVTYIPPDVTNSELCKDLVFWNAVWHCVNKIYGLIWWRNRQLSVTLQELFFHGNLSLFYEKFKLVSQWK